MRRYFRAVRLKNDTGEASLGITEESHGGAVTASIASLYYPEGQSNKQAFDSIMRYVTNQLEPGEQAKIFLGNIKLRRSYVKPYESRCTVVSKRSDAYPVREAQALAKDALRRRSSIQEDLR